MENRTKVRLLRGFSATLLVLLLLSVFVRENFQTVVVSGRSMLPTLHNGQRVLICKAYWLVGPIREGDIVVAKPHLTLETDDRLIIKRVDRLEGQVVSQGMTPDNWQSRNGKYIVPEGTVYVLGDNEDESEDSRTFGPLPVEAVLGKVLFLP